MARELSEADLERLNQLASMKEKGILTEEEFAEQKANLLSSEPIAIGVESLPYSANHRAWKWWLIGGGIISLALLLSMCGSAPETAAGETADVSPSTDLWQSYTKLDPLTGEEIVGARASLTDAHYQIDATVECTNLSKLEYVFSFFDGNEEPVPLTLNADGGTSFTTRVNEGGIINYRTGPLRYSNSMSLTAGDTAKAADLVAADGILGSEEALSGSVLLPLWDAMFIAGVAGNAFREKLTGLLALSDRARFKFQLSNGDAFVDIHQGEGPVAGVIDSCLLDKQRRLQALKQAEEESKVPLASTPATATATQVTEFSTDEQALIDRWASLEETCRGSIGDPGNACEERSRALKALNRAGICWGKKGQVNAGYEIHRCGPDSL